MKLLPLIALNLGLSVWSMADRSEGAIILTRENAASHGFLIQSDTGSIQKERKGSYEPYAHNYRVSVEVKNKEENKGDIVFLFVVSSEDDGNDYGSSVIRRLAYPKTKAMLTLTVGLDFEERAKVVIIDNRSDESKFYAFKPKDFERKKS